MELEKKVVLLTGARRIGQAVAVELAKKKANLAIAYRSSAEEAEAMCNDCKAVGVQAEPFKADLSEPKEVIQMLDAVEKRFGQIDAAVHMAANYPKTPFKSVSVEDYDSTMNIISRGAFIIGTEVGRRLLRNPSREKIKGKIIFFSDWAANRAPYKDYLPYHMAKGSVETLTRALAVELKPFVTVNCIAPGPILRPPDLSNEDDREVEARTLLKPWPGAIAIAKPVLFLLEEADFMTGQIMLVDGGRSIA